MIKSYLAASLLALSNLPACTKPNPIEKFNFSNWNTIFSLETVKNPSAGEVSLGISDSVAVYHYHSHL